MVLPLLHIKVKNAESASVAAPRQVAIIVGGTSGLGEHTAYRFAQYNEEPVIYIIGRRISAGARVISNLRKINSNPNCCFRAYGCDVTLVSEVDELCSKILAQEKKVNLLFLSPGFTTLTGRVETPIEGLDVKMAVNYYGRWRFVDRLMPLLQAAAEEEKQLQSHADNTRVVKYGVETTVFTPKVSNARVMVVLHPGNEGKPIMSDLDLKNHYTLANAHRHFVEFTSLAVMRFARLYPDVGFIHAGPGVVNTGIARSLPIWARIPSRLAMMFANTPDNASERLYYMATAASFRKGAHLIDGNNNSMKDRAIKRGLLTEELQDTVWNHTEDMYNLALRNVALEKSHAAKKSREDKNTKSGQQVDDYEDSVSLKSSELSL